MTVGATISLRDVRNCDVCGEKLCRTQIPLFWRVHVERMAIDINVARSLDGLTLMLGSQRLAEAFAPSTDLIKPLGEATELLICDPCGMQLEGRPLCIAELAEIASRAAERRAAKVGA